VARKKRDTLPLVPLLKREKQKEEKEKRRKKGRKSHVRLQWLYIQNE
jgi:hypothetical protein